VLSGHWGLLPLPTCSFLSTSSYEAGFVAEVEEGHAVEFIAIEYGPATPEHVLFFVVPLP
jgi:hypothetical protein